MLYRARYHYIEKYNLKTGVPHHRLAIYAVLSHRQTTELFDNLVEIRACEAPTKYDQWLLVAKKDAIASRFPDRKPWVESKSLAFLLLEDENDYAMAKMAFTLRDHEYGHGRGHHIDWWNENIYRSKSV